MLCCIRKHDAFLGSVGLWLFPWQYNFSSSSFCHILAGCVEKAELGVRGSPPPTCPFLFFLTSCEDYPIPSGALTANDKPWCWQKQRDPQTAMPAALELGKDPIAQSSLFCNNSRSIGLFRGLYAVEALLCYWFHLRCLEIRGRTRQFSLSLLLISSCLNVAGGLKKTGHR